MRRVGGRYRLLEQIGRGGMAEVWRALDERLGREVAVKILHPQVSPTERQRFAREVKALSRLGHPGVVQIHDLGEEDGRLYFVMELVEGGPFDRLGPYEEGPEGHRLLSAAAEVLDALAYLHQRGIIHRDLTPANILTTPEGHAKVMDFGLAYLRDSETTLTRTGYTLGTPLYMAPEQATGGEATPAADLYSLGAVLYKAITGEPPFQGQHDQAILYQHVYQRPDPPELKNPAVFPALSRLVLSLLEKDPSARPASAALVRSRLGRLIGEHRRRAYRAARAGASRSGRYPEGPLEPARLRPQLVASLRGEAAWPGELVARGERVALSQGRRGLAVIGPSGVEELATADEVTAPPLWDDRLYYADLSGNLWAWGEGGGELLLSAQGEVTASPLKQGDRLYLPSRDGRLYTLSPGGPDWVFQAGGHLSSGVTLYRGMLFLASEDGWVHVLEPATGRQLYKVDPGPIHVHMPAADGVILFPTWPGEVHAFDPLAREVLWTFDIEGEIWASPAVGYGLAFLAGWNGEVYAVDLKTGDEVWRAGVGRVTAGLSLAAGTLYLGTEEGRLYAFEARTGRPLLELARLGEIQTPPLPREEGVYLATLSGRVYLLKEEV